jgi:hypothetical protein
MARTIKAVTQNVLNTPVPRRLSDGRSTGCNADTGQAASIHAAKSFRAREATHR